MLMRVHACHGAWLACVCPLVPSLLTLCHHPRAGAGGCGVTNLRRATSPQHVAAAWRHFHPDLASRPQAPLVVMTNELEPRYFRRLRALVPSAIFGNELLAAARRDGSPSHGPSEAHDDNYLDFQTLRFAARHAAARIGTTGCYLSGGCSHQLVEACAGGRRRRRR